jgi:hypothetical protein
MMFLRTGSTSRPGPRQLGDQGTGRTGDEGHPRAIFLRGLSIGALVGAAIAGSTIWERRRGRRAGRGRAPVQGESGPGDAGQDPPTA